MQGFEMLFENLRFLLNGIEDGREKALVKTKIDEAELWLSKCKFKDEGQYDLK